MEGMEGMEGLLKLKASLASAEVSAGAVAKADQYVRNLMCAGCGIQLSSYIFKTVKIIVFKILGDILIFGGMLVKARNFASGEWLATEYRNLCTVP